jgi:hypothetical protein
MPFSGGFAIQAFENSSLLPTKKLSSLVQTVDETARP